MKTKLKFKQYTWLRWVIPIIFTFINNVSVCQSQNFENNILPLKIIDIEFSDTISYADTMSIRIHLVNESSRIFDSDFSIYYDIEETIPQSYDNEYDELDALINISLQPGDSISIVKKIAVVKPTFNPNDNSVIIIWPEVASLRSSLSNPESYSVIETYVIDDMETIEGEVLEEVMNNDDVLEEVSDEWHQEDEEADSNYGSLVSRKNKMEYDFNISEVIQNFSFSKTKQNIVINKTIDEYVFDSASIFSIDGKKLNVINGNFPIKIFHNNQPIVLKINVHHSNQPEITHSFTKIY